MTQEPFISHTEPLDAVHLEARLNRLRAALDACPAEVPASLAIPAREALDEVGERLALGVDHTVVALFGGTGSGKSSLFNALTQLQFADVGARRPTTSQAAACSWGDDASALLDFLGVGGAPPRTREYHQETTAVSAESPSWTPRTRTSSPGWSCSTCPTTTR